MTELKAIEILKQKSSIREDGESYEEFEEKRQACCVAISTLQTQHECAKEPCEYCENGEHNKWFENCGIESTMHIIRPYPWEPRWRLSVGSERVFINNCPKCGRELKEGRYV